VGSFAFDLFSTIGIMIVAEFADKTNLLALSLMGKSKQPYTVAIGGLIGIAFATLIGVILGGLLGSLLPIEYVPIFAGLIFLWIGLAELIENEKQEEENEEVDTQNITTESRVAVLKKSTVLIGLAEFGDKSQLFVIGRAVDADPFAIWLGAVIGMGIIMLVTAVFGEKLIEKLPEETVHKIANYGFVIAGFLLVITGIIRILKPY
jgi:putative Ca2+/H+ antiporter (TMEM165/GDT1 family)